MSELAVALRSISPQQAQLGYEMARADYGLVVVSSRRRGVLTEQFPGFEEVLNGIADKHSILREPRSERDLLIRTAPAIGPLAVLLCAEQGGNSFFGHDETNELLFNSLRDVTRRDVAAAQARLRQKLADENQKLITAIDFRAYKGLHSLLGYVAKQEKGKRATKAEVLRRAGKIKPGLLLMCELADEG